MILCFELGCGMIFAYFELLLVGVPFVGCFGLLGLITGWAWLCWLFCWFPVVVFGF